MRLLAIGDIHGCSLALQDILRQVKPTKNDHLVVLGDMVDRGPDSKGVIDTLLSLSQQTNLICLSGNHEQMMLKSVHDMPTRMQWLRLGGEETLDSFQAKTFDDIPDKYWKFLRSLPFFHETEHHIFAHANLKADQPIQTQEEATLLWERMEPEIFVPHNSGKTFVCGHTEQRHRVDNNAPQPIVTNGLICLDTAAHFQDKGALSCMNVFTHELWQAQEPL